MDYINRVSKLNKITSLKEWEILTLLFLDSVTIQQAQFP